MARLQSELNAARLQEFEAQEAAVTASAELDEARRTQQELAELRALRDNMAAAAALVKREVAGLRQQCEQERQAARRMRSEADKVSPTSEYMLRSYAGSLPGGGYRVASAPAEVRVGHTHGRPA